MKLFRTDYPLTPSFDLIRISLDLLKKNIWPVFYLMFLPSLVLVAGTVMLNEYSKPGVAFEINNQSLIGVGLVIAGVMWILLTFPGSIIMQLQAVRGKTPSAMECFKAGIPRIAPLILTMVLFEILIVAGLIALIIPALFVLRSFFLAQFYVVDRNLGPVKALKQSRAESLPNAGYIWGVLGVFILLSVFGSFLVAIPVIGYLLSMAVGLIYAFAPAYRYNEIKKLKLPTVV